MSLYSMTGFGRAIGQVEARRYVVELRSVNHRNLDLRIRLPRELAAGEAVVRKRLAAAVRRGHIDVNVSPIAVDADVPATVVVNAPLAAAYRSAFATLAEQLGVADTVDSAIVAALPGVLMATEISLDAEEISAGLGAAVDLAAEQLVEMRRREGEALVGDILDRLARIESHVGRISARGPELSAAYQARLEARILDLLSVIGAVELDAGRVLHEVAILAEKADVSEELARLASHVDQTRALLAGGAGEGQPVGRRLEFLQQELLREINTVGSKVQDLEVTGAVIEIKAELERMREQAQNVE